MIAARDLYEKLKSDEVRLTGAHKELYLRRMHLEQSVRLDAEQFAKLADRLHHPLRSVAPAAFAALDDLRFRIAIHGQVLMVAHGESLRELEVAEREVYGKASVDSARRDTRGTPKDAKSLLQEARSRLAGMEANQHAIEARMREKEHALWSKPFVKLLWHTSPTPQNVFAPKGILRRIGDRLRDTSYYRNSVADVQEESARHSSMITDVRMMREALIFREQWVVDAASGTHTAEEILERVRDRHHAISDQLDEVRQANFDVTHWKHPAAEFALNAALDKLQSTKPPSSFRHDEIVALTLLQERRHSLPETSKILRNVERGAKDVERAIDAVRRTMRTLEENGLLDSNAELAVHKSFLKVDPLKRTAALSVKIREIDEEIEKARPSRFHTGTERSRGLGLTLKARIQDEVRNRTIPGGEHGLGTASPT